MTIDAFETELQHIHSDLTIKQNPSRPAMAGIYYKGVYLCSCPNHNIYDAHDASYGVEGPGGKFYPHPSRPDVLAKVKGFIKQITNSKDYHDAFFGEGEYSDAKLAAGGSTDSGILVPDAEQMQRLNALPNPRRR
jgi:hypothetical protein